MRLKLRRQHLGMRMPPRLTQVKLEMTLPRQATPLPRSQRRIPQPRIHVMAVSAALMLQRRTATLQSHSQAMPKGNATVRMRSPRERSRNAQLQRRLTMMPRLSDTSHVSHTTSTGRGDAISGRLELKAPRIAAISVRGTVAAN